MKALCLALLMLTAGCKSKPANIVEFPPGTIAASSTCCAITFSDRGGRVPPRIVYVRGEKWLIVENAEIFDEGFDGITNCVSRTIEVYPGQSDPRMRETVVHELLHAGACMGRSVPDNHYWNSANVARHRGIHRLGEYEAELFAENPDLAAYLAGRQLR